jgi:hypothetical protein
LGDGTGNCARAKHANSIRKTTEIRLITEQRESDVAYTIKRCSGGWIPSRSHGRAARLPRDNLASREIDDQLAALSVTGSHIGVARGRVAEHFGRPGKARAAGGLDRGGVGIGGLW